MTYVWLQGEAADIDVDKPLTEQDEIDIAIARSMLEVKKRKAPDSPGN